MQKTKVKKPRLTQTQHLVIKLAEEKRKIGVHKNRYTAILADLRDVCPHDHVARCEWEKSPFGMSTYNPMRICMDCGLKEDEWSVEGNYFNGKLYHKPHIDVTQLQIYSYRKDL